MTTLWTPCADGNPVRDLGNTLEVNGDELTLSDGPCLVTVDLGHAYRLCERVDGPQPDWSQAPDWAHWWSISADGCVNWSDAEPQPLPAFGEWWLPDSAWVRHDGMIEIPLGIDWRLLKQQRPDRE